MTSRRAGRVLAFKFVIQGRLRTRPKAGEKVAACARKLVLWMGCDERAQLLHIIRATRSPRLNGSPCRHRGDSRHSRDERSTLCSPSPSLSTLNHLQCRLPRVVSNSRTQSAMRGPSYSEMAVVTHSFVCQPSSPLRFGRWREDWSLVRAYRDRRKNCQVRFVRRGLVLRRDFIATVGSIRRREIWSRMRNKVTFLLTSSANFQRST